MEEATKSVITLVVDLKKYRIRIHKNVLRLIGEPHYIQLLVNPIAKTVAVRGVEKNYAKDQTHRIDRRKMNSDNSYEIYSKDFVQTLCKVVGGLDEGYGYWMSGAVVPKEKLALFFMDTIQRFER